MKTKSLINKLKKAGFGDQVKSPVHNRRYEVTNGNTLLWFHDQDGDAVAVGTKPSDNYGDDNPFNSNCYKTWHYTLKSAVDYLVNDKHSH